MLVPLLLGTEDGGGLARKTGWLRTSLLNREWSDVGAMHAHTF
jgi:hypothetical protein